MDDNESKITVHVDQRLEAIAKMLVKVLGPEDATKLRGAITRATYESNAVV